MSEGHGIAARIPSVSIIIFEFNLQKNEYFNKKDKLNFIIIFAQ